MRNLLALLLFVPSLCLAQLPDYVPTEELYGWYNLDGDAQDASGNGHHGQPQLIQPCSGVTNNSGGVEFTQQNSLIEWPSDDLLSLEPQEAMTISIWFKSDFSQSPSHLFGKRSGCSGTSSINYQLAWQNDGFSQLLLVGMTLTLCDGFNEGYDVDSGWTHVVTTYDDGWGEMWVNGEIFMACSSLPGATNSSPFLLGGSGTCTGFYGCMDHLGIWNRALTAEEISQLYSASSPTLGCTDPTACNFDAEATADDGSCLLIGGLDLEECLEVTEAGELVLTVPAGLSSFAWEDGSSSPSRPIGVGGQFILTATVGDLPDYGALLEDGLVFHIDTANQEAHVATPTQVGDGAEFGCKFTTTGAWGTALGDGLANTEAILAACADPTIAAAVASNVGPGWFLPSQAELDAIRTRLHDPGFGSYFTDNTHNWYWSSTECEASPDDAAGSMLFTDGFYAACNNKDSNPGGVIAAKRVPLDICFVSDTLFIASPCISATPEPACGPGTVWDPVNEECIIAVPTDNDLDGCVSASDVLNLLSTFGTCPPIPEWPDEPTDTTWTCGDPVTYWDYDYATVLIGEQCWFSENLRNTQFRNSEAISGELDGAEWASTNEAAQTIYGEGTNACFYGNCDPAVNLVNYGRLYNGHAVQDVRGLCPTGWHVPTDNDWMALESHMGMNPDDLEETGWRPVAIGSLKASPSDSPGWDGTNDYGFTGLPGGARSQNDGHFYNGDHSATFWGGDACLRSLGTTDGLERAINVGPRIGASVRCLKD